MVILVLAASFVWTAETSLAKRPGQRHCYGGICVQVMTLPEVRRLLGKVIKQTASHYGDPSTDKYNTGTFTSNGERFNANDPTRTSSANFPDGTELLLRNPENGAVSHVRVNDFGPFWSNRELDVTERVAQDLGFLSRGIMELEVTVVAVPDSDDVRRLYRKDRQPVPTMGFLGKRTEAETAVLAEVLARRYTGYAALKEQRQAPGTAPAGASSAAIVAGCRHFAGQT